MDRDQSQGYSDRFLEHRRKLEDLCRRYAIDLFSLSTEDRLDQALFSVLHSRMQRQSREVLRQRVGGR